MKLNTESFKRFVQKAFSRIGIHIQKIPGHQKNKYAWIRDFNINTILDIGANVGDFALEMSRWVPEAKIYAFEPLKDVYSQLLQNTRKIQRFKAFNCALGDFNGQAVLKRSQFSQSSSLLEMTDLHKEAFPFTAITWEEAVSVKKLDDLVKAQELLVQSPFFIKIDVQGFEDKVIKGGEFTFRSSKIVLIEINFQTLYINQISFDEIYSIFKDLGFKCLGILEPYFHPKTGLPLFSDALFVKG